MEVFQGNWSHLEEFSKAMGMKYFVYQLTGRFGNQLLGLSDAFLMARQTHLRPLLLLSNATSPNRLPEWIEHLKDTSWFDVLVGKIYETPKLSRSTVFRHDTKIDVNSNTLYMGFTPNIHAINQSGLLTQETSPFRYRHEIDSAQISICVRVGDYINNPHLGILPIKYYQKVLRLIERDYGKSSDIRIFVDSPATKDSIECSWLANWGPITYSNDFLNDWTSIRNSQIIVASNSTFAFTASLRPSMVRYYPDPFYLLDKEFQRNLYPLSCNKVRYLRNPKARYLQLRIMQNLKSLRVAQDFSQ